MTDRPARIEKVFGDAWKGTDPTRGKRNIFMGEGFAVSPTNNLQPVKGAKVSSTKNLRNEG